MKINELMSENIIYASSDNTIEEVCSLMKTYDIGFLPVKDKDDYIGVVTDRDIVIRAISDNMQLETNIDEIITNDIISISSEADIEDALKLMSDYQIRRLLVTNKSKYVGILSLSDILSVNHNFNVLEYISNIFMPDNTIIYENEIELPEAEIDEFEL